MADPDLQLWREGGGGGTFEGLTMNVEFCEDNSDSGRKCTFSET